MRRKSLKIAIVAFTLLVLLVIAGVVAQPVIEERLRDALVELFQGSGRDHTMDPVRVELNLWRGQVRVYDVRVLADTTTATSKARFSFQVPELQLELGFLAMLRGRLSVQHLRLVQPVIHIDAPPHGTSSNSPNVGQTVQLIRHALSGYLSSVGITDLTVENARLEYVIVDSAGAWGFTVDSLALQLNGLVIDQGSMNAAEHIPLRDLRITFGEQEIWTRSGSARYHVGSFYLSVAEDSLVITDLGVESTTSDQGYAGERQLSAHVERFKLSGLHRQHTAQGDTLVATHILLDHPSWRVRGRRNMATVPHEHRGHDIKHMLVGVFPNARIDTLDIVRGTMDLAADSAHALIIGGFDLHVLGSSFGLGGGGLVLPYAGTLHCDSVHLLTGDLVANAGPIQADIGTGGIRINAIEVFPVHQSGKGVPDLQVASVQLKGWDSDKWVLDRSLVMDSLTINGAHVRLRPPHHRTAAGIHARHVGDHPARLPLPEILDEAGIHALRISFVGVDGGLEMPSESDSPLSVELERFSWRSFGLRCPEGPGEPHRDLFTDRSDLELTGLLVRDGPAQLDILVDRTRVSTEHRSLRLKHTQLHRGGDTGMNVEADALEIFGLDLPALIDERGLYIHKVELRHSAVVLNLPDHSTPRPSADAPSFNTTSVLGRHLFLDTLDVTTDSLLVIRNGERIARVDSFYFHSRNIRPDPPNFRPGRLAFLRNGLRYGGRDVELHVAEAEMRSSGFDIDIDGGYGEARDATGTVILGGMKCGVRIPRITGSDFDPQYVNTTEVVDLGRMVLHDARFNLSQIQAPPRPFKAANKIGGTRPFYAAVHARDITIADATVALELNESAAQHIVLEQFHVKADDLHMRLLEGAEDRLTLGPVSITVGKGHGGRARDPEPWIDLEQLVATAASFRIGADGTTDLQDLQFSSEAMELRLTGGDQIARVGPMRYDQGKSELSAEGVHLAPLRSQEEHASQQAFRTDAIVLDIALLKARGLNARTCIKEKRLAVDHIGLTGVVINDLRDHRLPIAPFTYKPLPPKKLVQTNAHFRIDTLDLRDGTVKYAERSHRGLGKLELGKMEVRLLGLATSGTGNLVPLSVDAHGTIQNDGPFHASLKFLPNSPNTDFTYHFALGTMDLKSFNSLLEPSAHMSFRRGRLDTLFVVAEADDDVAIGKLQMYYADLHVDLLAKALDHKSPFPVVESMVANALVRTHRRREKNREPSTVYFERMQDRSIFQYLIRQTASGIPGALRLPDKKGKVRKSEKVELKERLERDVN